jgi:AraC-like DNA-binding protein
MTQSDVGVFRASTTHVRGKAGMDEFREQFGRAILRLELMPLDDHPLTCDCTIRAWEDLGIATGELSPMSNHHPEGLGDDGVILAVLRRGEAQLTQARGTIGVPSGTAVFHSCGDWGTFTGFTPTAVTNIRLQREILTRHMPNLSEAFGQLVVAADNMALRLLTSYADVLADPTVNADREARRTVTSNIYDLTVLALGGARDVRVHSGGVRAARLHAIRLDILHHLADPALSIGAVAQRQGISASYVRRLFAIEGTSFADYVCERRLAAAHDMLRDPRVQYRTISSIAFEVGFGDLSYFNRTFRRRYGMTPSDVRGSASG